MRVLLSSRAWVVLFLVGLVVLGAADASAQRRKKPSRRVSNPVAPTPTPTPSRQPEETADPTIVSTADAPQGADPGPGSITPSSRPRTTGTSPVRPATGQPSDVNQTIDNLSTQVNKLGDRLNALEDDQKGLLILERLGRAEQRAEELRAQLRDVQSKELDYQARMEQLQIDMRPENIDMSIATFGTTRPEDVRAQRRLQLESEKKRVQAQLDLLGQSRTRLEAALSTADTEVSKLRGRVDALSDATKAADKTEQTPQDPAPAPVEEAPIP